MNFHIISLFPESFDSYLNASILSRAKKEKEIKFHFYNPRDFVKPTKSQKNNQKPYLRVDERPYGGGAGMVMQALPVIKAVEAAIKKCSGKILVVWLSPGGKQFDTNYAKKIAKKYDNLIFICGRYEGIDERVKSVIKNITPPAPLTLRGEPKREPQTKINRKYNNEIHSKLSSPNKIDILDISIGPYVLTGGELPTMIMIDSISRQIEGVLGNFESLEESRVSSHKVYTRPEVLEYKSKKTGQIKKYRVPKVLLSGNHKKIDEWKMK